MSRLSNIDNHVRQLAVVTDGRPSAGARASAPDSLLDAILATPGPAPRPGRGARRPGRAARRPVVITALAVLAIAGSAAASEAIFGSAQNQTSLECNIRGALSVIDGTSGNPVADCSVEWRRQTGGSTVPPLAAYLLRTGGVEVQPAADRPPAGSQRLPAGTVMGTQLIVLNEWLGDYINGLSSRCFSDATATASVHAELASLGLAGWSISSRPPAANGTTTCASGFIIFGAQRHVLLLANPAAPPRGEASAFKRFQTLARSLRPVSATCQDLPATAARVRAIARRLGLSSGLRLDQVTVPSATCTSIYENVGGLIVVTLRGPAGP
jgi:hypothetical protein